MHLWSFYTCVLLDTTCSLCKRVYPYQLGTSSSDVFGVFLCWLHVDGHVSDLWVKLTTADRVYNSCTAALTDCKGVSSHSPIFSTILAVWLAPIPEWGNSWGSQMPTSSFFSSLPNCLGTLEGWRLGLGLKHFLDGPLHRTGAIGGACYSLHKALCPHSSTPSGTAFKSYYSWGISWLSP